MLNMKPCLYRVTGGEIFEQADDCDGREWRATITVNALYDDDSEAQRTGTGIGKSPAVALKRAVAEAI